MRRAGASGILLAILLAFGWLPPLNDAVYPPPEASVMATRSLSGTSSAPPVTRKTPALGGASPSPAAPTTEPLPTPGHSLTGTASWGYFSGHVVTRVPRGTPITVIGPLGSWSGKSWGYGPAKWTGRIVDADREVFRLLCGDPSKGLCTVTLEW